jgi:hypothetical protein
VTSMIKRALVGVAAAGAMLGVAQAASAAVVCNGAGVCWHVRGHYAYRPEYGVVVHEDGWRWGPNDHYRWREHAGRGYWRDDRWVRF